MISRKKAENRVRSFKFCQHITEVLSYYIKKKYSSIPQSPKTTKSKLRHSEIHSWSQKACKASPPKPCEHWHSQQTICQSHLGSVFFFSSANVQTDFPKFMRFNICYNRLQRKKRNQKNLSVMGIYYQLASKTERWEKLGVTFRALGDAFRKWGGGNNFRFRFRRRRRRVVGLDRDKYGSIILIRLVQRGSVIFKCAHRCFLLVDYMQHALKQQ